MCPGNNKFSGKAAHIRLGHFPFNRIHACGTKTCIGGFSVSVSTATSGCFQHHHIKIDGIDCTDAVTSGIVLVVAASSEDIIWTCLGRLNAHAVIKSHSEVIMVGILSYVEIFEIHTIKIEFFVTLNVTEYR